MKISVQVATLIASMDRNVLCTHVQAKPCILFSGTRTWRDLLFDDLDVRPRRWPASARGGAVHGGFADRTERLAGDECAPFVREHDSFVLAGHSLGGACAILMASRLCEQGKIVESVYTYGVPQIGTVRFQKYFAHQGLWTRTINFYTPRDPVVTRLPNIYKRVGSDILLEYDSDDVWNHHDMATYASLLTEQASPPS